MKHKSKKTATHLKTPESSLSSRLTLAELLCNPVPEDFENLTGPLPYLMTNDALFHIVFEVNSEALKSLICSLINLNPADILSIEVTNPIELGHTIYDKAFVLDTKILLNTNSLINIEMQVVNLNFWRERSLGYLCRAFDNLNKGDNYSETKPATHIGILDFEVFPGDTEFYATYHLTNDISHKIYSDKFRLSVLQLNQAEHATPEDRLCGRYLWAKFFKATTWEEIHMLAKQSPVISSAAQTLYRVTQDERILQFCDAREMGERTQRTLTDTIDKQNQQIADLTDSNNRYKALLEAHGIPFE